MADLASSIMLHRAEPNLAEIARSGLSFRVEPGLGIAKLRMFGAEADARFRGLVGIAPPPACTQTETQGLTCAWLAPAEWLITGQENAVADWLEQLAGLDADDLLAIDLTHARTAFLIEGPNACEALAAHCPLDLWPGAFPVGAVARSLLGDAKMFIARLEHEGETPRFRIIVDQTMAPYAARLLART